MLAIGARAGSLPSGARLLSGLREDFLAGRWQTNERGKQLFAQVSKTIDV
jgi:hypothetical protein